MNTKIDSAKVKNQTKKQSEKNYEKDSRREIQIRIEEGTIADIVSHFKNPTTLGRWQPMMRKLPPATKIVEYLIDRYFQLYKDYQALSKENQRLKEGFKEPTRKNTLKDLIDLVENAQAAKGDLVALLEEVRVQIDAFKQLK